MPFASRRLYVFVAQGACSAMPFVALGCSHGWDDYDPRAGVDGGAVASSTSGSGGSGAATATIASSTSSVGGGASSSSAGGGGGAGATVAAAYSFDEGAGTTLLDASGNQNDGIVQGATWVTGKHGGALHFDGISNHATIASNPTWEEDGLAQYTIEGWIKVLQPGNYRGAIAIGPWSGAASIRVNNGAWEFAMSTAGGPNNWLCGTSSPEPYLLTVDGEFHHVAGVLDAAAHTCSLYIDGIAASNDQFVDGTSSFGGGNLILGGFDGSNYLACELDDVRVYKRALSGDEILLDMGTPVQGP